MNCENVDFVHYRGAIQGRQGGDFTGGDGVSLHDFRKIETRGSAHLNHNTYRIEELSHFRHYEHNNAERQRGTGFEIFI